MTVLFAGCQKCNNKVKCALEGGAPISVEFAKNKPSQEIATKTCWYSHEIHQEIKKGGPFLNESKALGKLSRVRRKQSP